MAGGAFKDNKNGVKLKDPDIRQIAYERYCEWVALGNSKQSFYFEHEDLTCTFETLDSYIKQFPAEFPPVKMNVAKAKGLGTWENVVYDSAKGLNRDANTASLQMLMRNKFGWDKKKEEAEKEEES